MKSVSVILLDARSLGGIQLMTFEVMRILRNNDYPVTFVTSNVSSTVMRYLSEMKIKGLKIRNLPKIPTITGEMYFSHVFYREKEELGMNMHGDIQPIESNIIYFHQFNIDYRMRSPLFKRMVLLPQYYVRKRFLTKVKTTNNLVLVNSEWTKREARDFWGINARVLHPPVSLTDLRNIYTTERENRVVTISRFSPDRGLENVLKTANNSEFKFTLAGFVENKSYFKRLDENKGKNVELIPNIGNEEKVKLFSRSKVYLNPTPYVEGFGVSVVEGMAAGLIPVTKNTGGVLDFVPKEFMFEKIDEAPSLITNAMRSWGERKMYDMKGIAETFSSEVFEKRLLTLLEEFR
ncbi:hypothetical protein HS7_15210 [Sulfolobales archaeon HS-7]|nr:hypothetical protein HS7_15210 [Sulfolobales archaeon HS-7]